MKEPKLTDILLLAKLSDGTIRQVIMTKEQTYDVLDLLVQHSKDGKMRIHEPVIHGIDFEPRWNLSETLSTS